MGLKNSEKYEVGGLYRPLEVMSEVLYEKADLEEMDDSECCGLIYSNLSSSIINNGFSCT